MKDKTKTARHQIKSNQINSIQFNSIQSINQSIHPSIHPSIKDTNKTKTSKRGLVTIIDETN